MPYFKADVYIENIFFILVVIGDYGSTFGISKGKYCFLVIRTDEYAYGMLSNKGLWRIVKPVFTLCTKRF